MDGLEAVMRSREEPQAVRYDHDGGGRGAPGDGRTATIARMDWQREFTAERRAALEDEVRRATELLYGEHGTGGLGACLGLKHADAVYISYIELTTSREAARACGFSPDYTAGLCRQAFAYIDEVGFAHVRAATAERAE